MTDVDLLRDPRAARGATVVEACAALALAGAAAVTLVGGLAPLSCALRVEAARSVLKDALLEARLAAYRSETSVGVAAAPGSGVVVLRPAGSERSLGDGITVTAAPADGEVQFRGNGLADNATVSITCGASSASVVVNQRGVIR